MDFAISLGQSRMGAELTWSGTPNSHLYVSGQSGSGKSCFLKHCIAQLPQRGVRCIVFDYAGDLHRIGGPCNCLDARTQVGIDPFRPLILGDGCQERPYDTAARIAETVLSIGGVQGGLQQAGIRNVLKDYIDRGATKSGFSGLIAQIQNDAELARRMAPMLIRLQDLNHLLSSGSQNFSWKLEQPGITVLRFDTLPNISAQILMTQFFLFDLWAEKLSWGESSCPVVVVLDECQRFRFTDNSIFTRILREGRKYHFSGWFASQWISEKGATKALSQAALKAYFYPGNDQVNALARHLCSGTYSLEDYKKMIQGLRTGEFLYLDHHGSLLVNCVPRMVEETVDAQRYAKKRSITTEIGAGC